MIFLKISFSVTPNLEHQKDAFLHNLSKYNCPNSVRRIVHEILIKVMRYGYAQVTWENLDSPKYNGTVAITLHNIEVIVRTG